MRIAIDLTPLYGRKHTGVELYAIDLYKALLTTKNEIIPIFHEKNEIDSNPKAFIIKKTNRLWLENVALHRAIKKINADIALFPIFPPPFTIYRSCKSKIIPTLHDFAFLKYRKTLNFAAKYYLTPKMIRAFAKADAFITISETIKKELLSHTSKPIYNCGENIAEEYLNASEIADVSVLNRWNLSPESYVISVSTIEPRKNMKYLIQVIKPFSEKTNKKLVLVGRKGWETNKDFFQILDSMKDYIIQTGYLEFRELVSLYRYADFFALLSLDEGFGRTPFEAVASGCRKIVLSDIDIFRETFDKNATFLPLDDIKQAQNILASENLSTVRNDFQIPFKEMQYRLPLYLDTIFYEK